MPRSAGDTVEVLAGEYREQVRLKDGVTLRSHMPHEAVLRAAPMSRGPAVVAESVKRRAYQPASAFWRTRRSRSPPASRWRTPIRSGRRGDCKARASASRSAARQRSPAGQCHPRLPRRRHARSPALRQPWISHNAIRRNQGSAIAARDGARPVLDGNVFEKGRSICRPRSSRRPYRNGTCSSTYGPAAARLSPPYHGKKNDRPRRPQTRQIRDPPQAGARRHGGRVPGAGYGGAAHGGAQADRAQRGRRHARFHRSRAARRRVAGTPGGHRSARGAGLRCGRPGRLSSSSPWSTSTGRIWRS